MTTTETTHRLEQKGVKPTANRILVYRKLCGHTWPQSLADLEAAMPQMDKSSIFRVLSLFLEHDVVHSFSDGRGIVHYELCGSQGECHHRDQHPHFYCESCHRSFCLDDVTLPDVVLPQGFTPHAASFVIKGECAECSKSHLS